MGPFVRLFSFLLVIKYACSLQFYLKEGQTLCFGENIAPNAKVLAEYTVAAGSGHMPVDIIVRDLAENKTLYERSDINHGKFAFIAPFGEELPHIHSAELEKKTAHSHDHDHHHYSEHRGNDEDYHHHHHDSPPEHDHGHDWDSNHHDRDYIHHHDEATHHRQTRGLLSYDNHDNHEHHHDNHDFENHHDHNNRDDHHEHDSHHHESHYGDHVTRDYHEHQGNHDGGDHEKKLDHMDAHDGEHGNMEDEWDMDKYDGIHDEDLEKDWNENESKHPGKHDDDIDEDEFTREAALFKERKFEICLISRSNNININNSNNRRVRLHLRHGKAAHDYTRLAKKEHLTSLELTLRIVSDELKELHTELDHARQLEDALRILNESTERRVVNYASLSMVVLVAVSAFQAMYTKRFFKTKKLL